MKIKKGLQIVCIWMLMISLTACGGIADLFEVMPDDEAVSIQENATQKPVSTERPKQDNAKDKEATATEPAKKEDNEVSSTSKESGTAEEKLVYDLTKEHIAEFDKQRNVCREMIQASKPYEEVETEIEKLYEIATEIQDKTTVAEILYYCHMNDTKAVKNYLDGTELLSELILEYNELLLEMY